MLFFIQKKIINSVTIFFLDLVIWLRIYTNMFTSVFWAAMSNIQNYDNSLDTLLESESVTLDLLLNDENFLSQLQAQNSKLISL